MADAGIVRVRLEGTRENVRAVARALRWVFWVLDQSREYPNRTSVGIVRCYIRLYPGQLRVALPDPGDAPAAAVDGEGI